MSCWNTTLILFFALVTRSALWALAMVGLESPSFAERHPLVRIALMGSSFFLLTILLLFFDNGTCGP